MMRSPLVLFFLCVGLVSAGAADFATQATLCTYKLFFPTSTGTCFLLSRPRPDQPESRQYLLVTAAHVLEGISADDATLVLRRALPDEAYQRADTTIHIRRNGKPLWSRHASEDVAVLPLDLPADAPVSALDLESLGTEEALRKIGLHVGSALFSAVYPERREANGEGFPIIRPCNIASFPFLPVATHKTFLVDAFAFHGDSGGLVFARDERKGSSAEECPPIIVGIVVSMWHTNEKTETPTETREVHTPLGLATVIHAHYIKETVDLIK